MSLPTSKIKDSRLLSASRCECRATSTWEASTQTSLSFFPSQSSRDEDFILQENDRLDRTQPRSNNFPRKARSFSGNDTFHFDESTRHQAFEGYGTSKEFSSRASSETQPSPSLDDQFSCPPSNKRQTSHQSGIPYEQSLKITSDSSFQRNAVTIGTVVSWVKDEPVDDWETPFSTSRSRREDCRRPPCSSDRFVYSPSEQNVHPKPLEEDSDHETHSMDIVSDAEQNEQNTFDAKSVSMSTHSEVDACMAMSSSPPTSALAIIQPPSHEENTVEAENERELEEWLEANKLGHLFQLLVENEFGDLESLRTAPQDMLDSVMSSMKAVPRKHFSKAIALLRKGEGINKSSNDVPTTTNNNNNENNTGKVVPSTTLSLINPAVEEEIPEVAQPLRETERQSSLIKLQEQAEHEIAVIQHIIIKSRRESHLFSESALSILEASKSHRQERAKRLKTMCKEFREPRDTQNGNTASTYAQRPSYSDKRVSHSSKIFLFHDGTIVRKEDISEAMNDFRKQQLQLAEKRSVEEENERIRRYDEEKKAKEEQKLSDGGWRCGTCKSINGQAVAACSICSTSKPFAKPTFNSGFADPYSPNKPSSKWTNVTSGFGNNVGIDVSTKGKRTRAGTKNGVRDSTGPDCDRDCHGTHKSNAGAGYDRGAGADSTRGTSPGPQRGTSGAGLDRGVSPVGGRRTGAAAGADRGGADSTRGTSPGPYRGTISAGAGADLTRGTSPSLRRDNSGASAGGGSDRTTAVSGVRRGTGGADIYRGNYAAAVATGAPKLSSRPSTPTQGRPPTPQRNKEDQKKGISIFGFRF